MTSRILKGRLHCIRVLKHGAAAQVLVDAKAIVNVLDCNKKTPLNHAFEEIKFKVMEVLLNAKARLHYQIYLAFLR